eukprot:TRINITY_DN2958_c0_g1_i2.p1 TRINITY_DN2958_c0_g1~~TRINITY_DN2958_c0_g1_i2.p1  ORF type:complete len:100 (+),score=37.83 TRINITY_DN2958_c0_g1_i2:84-383(+)
MICDFFVYCTFFFFFQAEDGIRDLVRSRGLGDVYKRQHLSITVGGGDGGTRRPLSPLSLSSSLGVGSSSESQSATIPLHSSSQFPVSYTHLTLPTIYSV